MCLGMLYKRRTEFGIDFRYVTMVFSPSHHQVLPLPSSCMVDSHQFFKFKNVYTSLRYHGVLAFPSPRIAVTIFTGCGLKFPSPILKFNNEHIAPWNVHLANNSSAL